jgi:hypothetical protein
LDFISRIARRPNVFCSPPRPAWWAHNHSKSEERHARRDQVRGRWSLFFNHRWRQGSLESEVASVARTSLQERVKRYNVGHKWKLWIEQNLIGEGWQEGRLIYRIKTRLPEHLVRKESGEHIWSVGLLLFGSRDFYRVDYIPVYDVQQSYWSYPTQTGAATGATKVPVKHIYRKSVERGGHPYHLESFGLSDDFLSRKSTCLLNKYLISKVLPIKCFQWWVYLERFAMVLSHTRCETVHLENFDLRYDDFIQARTNLDTVNCFLGRNSNQVADSFWAILQLRA